MKMWIGLGGLLLSSYCFAALSTVNMNPGKTEPTYQQNLQTCPHPVNCSYGANYLRLSDANSCGCCACDGGSVGCSGGAKGYVVCADGTYATGCACQYIIRSE